MLYQVKTLKGYKLRSLDGEIGKVVEFFFDDSHWTIRYLVAQTGDWLKDRQVLISPHVLYAVNKEEQYISVDLTKKQTEDSASLETHDSNCRSTMDVSGYIIQASDGEIGHVDDFIIDDETWTIRYLVIDTKNWWPGKKILISPKWIERVSWEKSKVFVNLFRKSIEQSPEFTDESLITRDYEHDLHCHYHREGYWVKPSATEQHSH